MKRALLQTAILTGVVWLSVCTTRFAIDYSATPWWFIFVAAAAFGWIWSALFGAMVWSEVMS